MNLNATATDYDYETRVAEGDNYRPLRKSQPTKKHSLRVLGVGDDVPGYSAPPSPYRRAEELLETIQPLREDWVDTTPYHRDYPLSRQFSAQIQSYDYGSQNSYYQDAWHHNSSATSRFALLRNHLRLPGKRLSLFLILSLMAVGLIVAITPALAKGGKVAQTQRGGLALSGYMDGATVQEVQQVDGETVPVIDVSTDQAAPVDSADPKPAIQNLSSNEGKGPKSGEILGAPSISVKQIEAVLKQYGSPAAGKGHVLYDLGVKYGIDPAYALAFFVHESGCGTKGVARFTKSLGNIRTTPGYADYQGYRSYPTWESGMEDWYKLITNLYIGEWGLRTVEAIIPVYAPWGDNNNPPSYIASVKNMVNSWRGK